MIIIATLTCSCGLKSFDIFSSILNLLAALCVSSSKQFTTDESMDFIHLSFVFYKADAGVSAACLCPG